MFEKYPDNVRHLARSIHANGELRAKRNLTRLAGFYGMVNNEEFLGRDIQAVFMGKEMQDEVLTHRQKLATAEKIKNTHAPLLQAFINSTGYDMRTTRDHFNTEMLYHYENFRNKVFEEFDAFVKSSGISYCDSYMHDFDEAPYTKELNGVKYGFHYPQEIARYVYDKYYSVPCAENMFFKSSDIKFGKENPIKTFESMSKMQARKEMQKNDIWKSLPAYDEAGMLVEYYLAIKKAQDLTTTQKHELYTHLVDEHMLIIDNLNISDYNKEQLENAYLHRFSEFTNEIVDISDSEFMYASERDDDYVQMFDDEGYPVKYDSKKGCFINNLGVESYIAFDEHRIIVQDVSDIEFDNFESDPYDGDEDPGSNRDGKNKRGRAASRGTKTSGRKGKNAENTNPEIALTFEMLDGFNDISPER